MTAPDKPRACVEAWMAHAAAAPNLEQLAEFFERAFSALWVRVQRTLGEVTLAAIVDRVLANAAARHSVFAHVRVDLRGLHTDELAARAASAGLTIPEVAAAAGEVLEDFLALLGRLTAEILTPALHAELASIEVPADWAELAKANGVQGRLRSAPVATSKRSEAADPSGSLPSGSLEDEPKVKS